jgi:restriction system protein
MLWFALAALIAIVVLKDKTVKGWLGEKITSTGMRASLDSDIYHKIDNVIVPSSNGTTQIDHVIISKYGIFVIETKNLCGWIYGNADDDRWTQNIYGTKHQFQNPLKQNYRHTKCLTEYLRIDQNIIKPIVYFVGDCEFKTTMPRNVLNNGLTPYITGFKQECLTGEQVENIEDSLTHLKQDKTLNKQAHLDSLSKRYESSTTCPKCGGQLIKRVARKGRATGNSFLGCSNYPKCKYVKNNSDQ